jgi:hypothetical protein
VDAKDALAASSADTTNLGAAFGAAGAVFGVMGGAFGVAGAAAGMGNAEAGKGLGTGGKFAGYAGSGLGVVKTIADAAAAAKEGGLGGGLGVLGAVASLAGTALGVVSAEGAGGVDIEERASGKIKMVAGNTLSGSAPLGISFKTATKFSVSATVQAKFETLSFSVTAGAKASITGYGSVGLKSLVKVSAEAPLFSVKAAKFDHKGASFTSTVAKVRFACAQMVVTGRAQVDKELRVKGPAIIDKVTTMKDHVKAMRDAKIKGKQEVDGTATIKGNVTAKSSVKVSDKVKSSSIDTDALKA